LFSFMDKRLVKKFLRTCILSLPNEYYLLIKYNKAAIATG
jgi:hypothetical protein